MNAVKWSYSANWGERAFGALFSIILASLLGPKDFGIVSLGVIYVMFLQMFLDQGFVAALIQRKDLDQKHLDAVFWMDVALSLVLVGVSVAWSRWWASVNHTPELAAVISVLSLCIPIEGLAVVQKTLLSREMDFKSLSIRSNVAVLASGIIGVGLAYAGLRVWALVAQMIIRDLIALVLLWRLSHWRPRLGFSWRHLRELMGFSVSNFIAQLGIFIDAQASSIVLSLSLGPVAVGLYRLAERLTGSVLGIATSSIQAVSLPEFSRFQRQPEQLRRSALMCIRLSAMVTMPALAGLAAVSTPLLSLLGPQWLPATGVLKILCVLCIAVIFHFFTVPMLQALSRTREIVILEWARTIFGVLILIGVGYLVRGAAMERQIVGVALARFVVGALVVTPVFLYILMRLCRISVRDFIAAIAPSALASAAVVAVVAVIQHTDSVWHVRPMILLAWEVVAGGVAGAAVVLALAPELRSVASRNCQKLFRGAVAPTDLKIVDRTQGEV
jgi:PST family polysaccharide transporter